MNKIEQTAFWPQPVLDHLQHEAKRLDRTFSYLSQMAWCHARALLTQAPCDVVPALPPSATEWFARNGLTPEDWTGAPKVRLALFYPEEMLIEIQEEAARRDRSISWILLRAFILAVGEIARIPTAEQ
mgnify:CR=1 FL=1